MGSVAMLLSTDAGSRWVRTGYRLATVLLVEWIFHFLYPGSGWCWVLYENGKKKRLFDFAGWLVFVSLINFVFPRVLMSAQKLESAWADSEYGRNMLCLSKIFGLRVTWQLLCGLMAGLGMRGTHQLHNYVRSDVQLLVGHLAAVGLLIATFFQSDVITSGEGDMMIPKVPNLDDDANEGSESAHIGMMMGQHRPFGYRPMGGGPSMSDRMQSPYRHNLSSNNLQTPMGSGRDARSPSPRPPRGRPAPRKRGGSTAKRKPNGKPRKRSPSGVNNMNGALMGQNNQSTDQWSFWNRSIAALQEHQQHHHGHQCGSNRHNNNDTDGGEYEDTYPNRSSCNNQWTHCAMHGHEPTDASRQMCNERGATIPTCYGYTADCE